jgi:hypothetical protein
MSAPKHEIGAFERAVDIAIDGLERGIMKIPAPALGVGIGLFLGWVVNIVATVGPVDYLSPLEAEAMNYNGGRDLLPDSTLPADRRATAAAASGAASTAPAHG